MSARLRIAAGTRCVRVVPRSRGGWVVMSSQGDVMSEHVTATEAEQAALARLQDGEELIVYDRYHRCHRIRRASQHSHDV